MTFRPILFAAILLPLLPLEAQARIDPEREKLLIQIFQENGCKTSQAMESTLPKHGFTIPEVREIEAKWRKNGWVSITPDGLTLSSKVCKP